MSEKLQPGLTLPDLELPDDEGTMHLLSELQGEDPMIVLLGRGEHCPRERQHQREGVFGYRVLVGARRDRDRDSALGGRGQIDRIIPDTRAGDDPQALRRLENPPRVRLRAGDDGGNSLDVAEQFVGDHLHGTARKNPFEAGIAQHL